MSDICLNHLALLGQLYKHFLSRTCLYEKKIQYIVICAYIKIYNGIAIIM